MGNAVEKPLKEYQDKSVRILMVGLHAAGKTTILYKLKLGELATTIPEIGFIGVNAERVDYNGTKFVVFDVGGRERMRSFTRHYYRSTNALVFVIDSSDRETIVESKDELWRLLREEELNKDVAILIMANKQDLPNAMSVAEIAEILEVQEIKHRKIHVQGTCAGTGSSEGLYEGLSWIQEALTYQELKKPVMKPVKVLLTVPERKPEHQAWLSKISNYLIPPVEI